MAQGLVVFSYSHTDVATAVSLRLLVIKYAEVLGDKSQISGLLVVIAALLSAAESTLSTSIVRVAITFTLMQALLQIAEVRPQRPRQGRTANEYRRSAVAMALTNYFDEKV